VVLLWAHVLALLVYAVAIGSIHVAVEVLVVAAPTLAAQLFPDRRTASAAAAFGLASASAVLVHLSGGLPEMHFHYFVVVALIALYQDIVPFGIVIAYVALQHGIFGTINAGQVFGESERDQPWWWASIHAGFIAAASAVGVAGWKINENLMLRERRRALEMERIMASAGEGIVAVDGAGTVVAANAAASELLRPSRTQPLVGRALADVFRPTGNMGLSYPTDSGELQRVTGAILQLVDGRRLDVDYTIAPLLSNGTVDGAVLTVRDVSQREAFRVAEAELARTRSDALDQRSQVLALQNAIMAPPPRLPGVDIGVSYVAASGPAGGDLYDVLRLPDGSVHLAVVDVSGKGVSATNAAVAVIYTLRTLTLEGCPLAQLIPRASATMGAQHPGLLATVVAARYEPDAGVLRAVFGGHPPIVVVEPDGQTSVHHSPGRGIGFPDPRGTVIQLQLAIGASAIFATDGLIEGSHDLDAGLDRVRSRAPATRTLGAAGMADALVRDAIAAAQHSDDIVALVLRRTGDGAPASTACRGEGR
jgi:serine phosphatase RsbU (regulator of sigma subunit)